MVSSGMHRLWTLCLFCALLGCSVPPGPPDGGAAETPVDGGAEAVDAGADAGPQACVARDAGPHATCEVMQQQPPEPECISDGGDCTAFLQGLLDDLAPLYEAAAEGCATDADCRDAYVFVGCPSGSFFFGGCGRPIVAANECSLYQAVADHMGAVCEQCRPSGCSSVPTCPRRPDPVCESGRCVRPDGCE